MKPDPSARLLTAAVAAAPAAMASTAVAHPGPPGHSHDEDEWPFETFALLAVPLAAVLGGAALLRMRSRRLTPSRA